MNKEIADVVKDTMQLLDKVDTAGILLKFSKATPNEKNGTTEIAKLIVTFLSGGFLGALFTQGVTLYRNRMQKMECHYLDHAIISTLPITTQQGETHPNIYSKKFLLKNSTNSDKAEFKLLFEFDKGAKIISHTNIGKTGVDRLKSQLLKPNEYEVSVRHFNRKEEVEFIFQIANIGKDEVNITECECTGFKIEVIDKRVATLNSKLTIVTKAKLLQ